MDGEFGSAMTDIILQKTQNKYRIMGYWSAGVRDYYGKKPITTAADMVGMTIRTQTSGVVSQFWTSIGATPVNIGWGALYDSLKNGEVDSAENDYTNLMLKERAVTYDMMDCSKEKCISDGAIVTEYSGMDIASFKNVAVSIQDSYAQSNGLTQYLEMVRRAQ